LKTRVHKRRGRANIAFNAVGPSGSPAQKLGDGTNTIFGLPAFGLSGEPTWGPPGPPKLDHPAA